MAKGWLSKIFKKWRGYSKDLGGRRELSSGFLSDRIRNKMVDILKHYEGCLLEIGCGEGLFLYGIKRSGRFKKIVGLELKEDMLNRAKKNLVEYREKPFLISGNGMTLPFKDASFDIVVCVNIFHNLPSIKDVEGIIMEIRRICRPSGRIAFDIRNGYNPAMNIAYKWVMTYDPSCKRLPLNTYFYHEIKKLLHHYGLKITEKKGVIFPLWFLSPALIIIAKRGN